MEELKEKVTSKRDEVKIENQYRLDLKKLATMKTAQRLKAVKYNCPSPYFYLKVNGQWSLLYDRFGFSNGDQPRGLSFFSKDWNDPDNWADGDEDCITVPTIIELILQLDSLKIHVTPTLKGNRWIPYVNGYQIKTTYWFNSKWKCFQFACEYATGMLKGGIGAGMSNMDYLRIPGIFKGIPKYYYNFNGQSNGNVDLVSDFIQLGYPAFDPEEHWEFTWEYRLVDLLDPIFEEFRTIYNYNKESPNSSTWTLIIGDQKFEGYTYRRDALIAAVKYLYSK